MKKRNWRAVMMPCLMFGCLAGCMNVPAAPETTAEPDTTAVPDTTAAPETTVEPAVTDEPMTVMSFNVYVANPEDRLWRVRDVIENYMPDSFGVQEASPTWMRYLKHELGEYDCVGLGRDGGDTGEHCAIFYRTDKYRLIESNTYWLSDTPEVVSKYSDSGCKRVFTYAILERLSDGARVMHANTHLDHTGDEPREKQLRVLMRFIEQYTDMPLILTGDFNFDYDSALYRYTVHGGISDAAKLAEITEEASTYHAYQDLYQIIDFCFVNPETIDVKRYNVIRDTVGGMYPSDHYPIMIEYRIAP